MGLHSVEAYKSSREAARNLDSIKRTKATERAREFEQYLHRHKTVRTHKDVGLTPVCLKVSKALWVTCRPSSMLRLFADCDAKCAEPKLCEVDPLHCQPLTIFWQDR